MVGEFRAILNNPASGFGIRSVVVDALALGTPLPEMLPDLAGVLGRQASPYAERAHALAALLRLGPAGKTALRGVYRQLGKSANDIRLRVEALLALYGDPYGATDAIALVNDVFESGDMAGSGTLWALRDHLPLADLPQILDGIDFPDRESGGFDRRRGEVASLYAHLLLRAWEVPGAFDPERALGWLQKRAAFKDGEGRARGLRAAMQNTPERLAEMTRHFFRTVPVDEQRWYAFNKFREAILFELSTDTMLDLLTEELGAVAAGSERQLLLFEFALALCIQATQPHADEVFTRLWSLAEGDARLSDARAKAIVTNLPDNYLSRLPRRSRDPGAARDKQRQDFNRDDALIRSGAHAGWLAHLGMIYFALFSDTERNATPHARLAAWLGEERREAALEALSASLSRNDLPSFADVMAMTAEHKHYDWWYALTAGLNERCSTGQGLAGLSGDFLKGMLAFDLANSVPKNENEANPSGVQPWRKDVMERRPDLAQDTYLAVARLRLSRNEQIADGIHELLTDAAFEPNRIDIVLDLLREFPNADPYRVDELLSAAAKRPAAHERTLALARSLLTGTALSERQRDLWLATAYVLSPSEFETAVMQRAGVQSGFIFDLRDKSGFADHAQPSHTPLAMLEFLTALAGRLYPEAPFPSEGWNGDHNPWDAAQWVPNLISTLSASPSRAATEALERLTADSALASYRPHLLHALANQRQRRRDAEYDRPDWRETIAALENGRPATAADLHALLVAHLLDLTHRIARTNTDIFKGFWNLDKHARPSNPRPEEACRDHLVDLMRPSLQPLGISVEPEGHMVADKRADISVTVPSVKILCELKRDYHAEVWTAIQGQLERFYTPDPEAKGFGVYGVFWFGDKRPSPIPAPPGGRNRPKTAAEMEQMLIDLISQDMRKRISVIVIDVSGTV
jgi:hypothetical protein